MDYYSKEIKDKVKEEMSQTTENQRIERALARADIELHKKNDCGQMF